MKKIWLLLPLLFVFSLAACNNKENIESVNEDTTNESFSWITSDDSIFGKRENEMAWKVAMQKPELSDMTNYNMITEWYTWAWEREYTLNELDKKTIEKCDKLNIYHYWYQEYIKITDKSDVIGKDTITVTGNYNYPNILSLTDDEKTVLSEKWWIITPIDSLSDFYKISYKEENSDELAWRWTEEWNSIYHKIWWDGYDLARNEANSILITNDLLLHSMHKLFDNSLKYYEQTVARNNILELSQTLFDKFSSLAKQTEDSELKETYTFLSIYRAIPSILLPTEEELSVNQYNEEYGYYEWDDPTDEQLKEILEKNADKYIKKINPEYRDLAKDIFNKILAHDIVETDSFMSSYSPDFIIMNEIKQDYTQFTPRSHYTDNAKLKTYFMAMKWLMREKFYFHDKKLAKAALVMAANISDEDISKLTNLSEKIKKLVWWDDDLTIESLANWQKENEFTDIDNIQNISDEKLAELLALVPQKIQSTYYTRPDAMVIDSDEAKDMTAWFVFFGEKFTLDSYLFDQVTAWSAETQYKYMPNIQTAMIVPEIFENNSDAENLVNLWMTSRMAKKEILEDNEHTQYSSYNEVKSAAKEALNKEVRETSVLDSVYHKWLNMLWDIIFKEEDNAPYFKLDPIYHLKNLVTYMWSYTELKHDTLLYVKQNYAELWWGGWGEDCWIWVEPPVLPAPKWYVEADLDVINKLIALNNELKSDFSDLDNIVTNNYIEFDKFLNHIRTILIQQMNNEVISDEDFERMRTAYDTLSNIIHPFTSDVTVKENRAALIADIFTSEWPNPLYEAVGRPAIILVMIDDINWKRIALWPVFTHYEFYDSDKVVDAKWSRLNDEQWQAAYDNLTWSTLKTALSTVSKHLQKWLKPEN